MYALSPDDRVYPVLKIAAFMEALAAEGTPAGAALRGCGLSEREVADPTTRVSLNQVIGCFRNALQLSRDRVFAYRAGQRLHVSGYGMYGFAILSSTDFRQTMGFAERYHPLATPLAGVAFSEADGAGVWTNSPLAHPPMDAELYRHVVEMQLGLQTTLHRDVMGSGFQPRELRVSFAPPFDAKAYETDLGTPVRFNQPRDEFVFDAAWLDGRPDLGNAVTYAAVVAICNTMVDDLKLGAGVVGRVRHLLMTNLMQPVSFERVASDLGVGARTLRRRLAEEGVSYRQLVEELRRDTAIKYLRDTDMAVQDVAYALGFSEPANFRHAFRRWTSSTPQQFRAAGARPRTAGSAMESGGVA